RPCTAFLRRNLPLVQFGSNLVVSLILVGVLIEYPPHNINFFTRPRNPYCLCFLIPESNMLSPVSVRRCTAIVVTLLGVLCHTLPNFSSQVCIEEFGDDFKHAFKQ